MTLLVASIVWRLCGSKKRYFSIPQISLSVLLSQDPDHYFSTSQISGSPYFVFKVILIRDSLLWQGLLKKLQVLVLA